jgi:hypothetical protein
MRRLEPTDELDHRIEPWKREELIGRHQGRRRRAALGAGNRDRLQSDRPVRRAHDRVSVLDQAPRQRTADVTEAEHPDSIWRQRHFRNASTGNDLLAPFGRTH